MRQATRPEIHAYFAAQGVRVKVSHAGFIYVTGAWEDWRLLGLKSEYYVDGEGTVVHRPEIDAQNNVHILK